MQARVEFFMEQIVNEALTRNARLALENRRDHHYFIMRLAARPCARMTSVLGAIICQHKMNWRQLRA